MFCGFPIEVTGRLRPCGKCQGCLRQRRRAWVGRMLVEQAMTPGGECSFVTLTYAPENLPFVHHQETDTWVWTLEKLALQKYLRAVRDAAHKLDLNFRYFACGEYGEETGRPHYHLIAFGLGIGARSIFAGLWKMGFVSVYEANARTMSYVAKYCLKGSKDPEPLGEFDPSCPGERATQKPFRLTSRAPPIGGAFCRSIADSMQTRTGSCVLVDENAYAKGVIRVGRDKYPLDRTMKDRVIRELDIPSAMSDALFRRDFEDPTDGEIKKAAQICIKATRRRHSRSKL